MTSDAGLLLPRELDERLGLSTLIERHLTDPRTGRNYQFPLPDVFRQSIYSRLAGYEDTNDAERLAVDPTFRMLASRERRASSIALTSTLHWFETEVVAEERNYQGLARLNTDLMQHEAARPRAQRLILDIDSSESPVHGTQEQAAYNGHFESVCWQKAFASLRSCRGSSYPDERGVRPCLPGRLPIEETNPLRPLSPYAVNKVAHDLTGYPRTATWLRRSEGTRTLTKSLRKSA